MARRLGKFIILDDENQGMGNGSQLAIRVNGDETRGTPCKIKIVKGRVVVIREYKGEVEVEETSRV